jgi:hypothetical protein
LETLQEYFKFLIATLKKLWSPTVFQKYQNFQASIWSGIVFW